MDTKELLFVIGCSILVVVLSIFFLKRWLKNLDKTKEQRGPSKEPQEGKDREIVHKKCLKKIYFSEKDIKYGDVLLISKTERIQQGYIICPHCNEELVFDDNG